ncbi:MAG TPA: primosomal protein N' [Candidatus Rubrimentiphilum sp.]|nr:primosomal protein N' [Candidatus Rubrimentiphilum sp.]
MPLSYDARDLELRIGDVVRVPLGSREHVAFVVSEPRTVEADRPLRAVNAHAGVPRAFDEIGLQLAKFVAAHYLCTLGEALSTVVLAGAVPRTVDTFVRVTMQPDRERFASVPDRLLSLIWDDLAEGFSLDQLLRHPEARRAGDRTALLRYLNALVRAGELRRERRFIDARTHEYRIKVLHPGDGAIKGPKAQALLEFVRAQPGVPRADALLAGFSTAIIARAVKAGAIREEEIVPARAPRRETLPPPVFDPTPEQRSAIDALSAKLARREHSEVLLHGITGSGKTFVYIEAIKDVLRSGGRAIVLVPEISLTPQIARRFEQAFGERVAVLHSALSERERFDAWQACAGGVVDVVVGARSAVFAPMRDVRLLVIDEAQETSYKQDTSPRYNAVRVGRERMRLEQGVLLLGSATPPLESYADVLAGRVELYELPKRATGQELPVVRIVDMAQEFEAGNRRIFSSSLSQALDDRMQRGEKSVLFVNRRGSGNFLLCRACGNVPECARCSVSLTVHRAEGLLRCHYCDAQRPIPNACESCGSESIRELGVGTQRVAEEVQRLYPAARVIRMDSDTTTRIGDHARLLDAFGEEGHVLVGTQMVAKGLDFPAVTLVGVVAADIGLHAPDFRAAERTFSLIMQVCGRSGRARPGEAIVQTYSPKHPAIVRAAAHDYTGFARQELADRIALRYPPACELLYLGIFGRNRPQALEQARKYAAALETAGVGEVLGPAPFPIARLNDEWRFRIALKGMQGEPMRGAVRARVQPLAHKTHTTRLAINVDP